MLFELLVVWLLGALLSEANTQPEQMGVSEDEQHVSRRYIESTIASEISKIMESMMQRNFVEFLLNQREKKSMPAATAEEDQELYNNLLKLSVHEKQKRKI
ncbi:gastric inhibitory polypeptide [Sebastes umbrosus]|uniref:gastric inhibitory polypeptide n=1 Tax=Sebastes umbrosus TaxID=72105 RepID=UPI00189DD909|nr:gastric inhibitory polypeptide [Sebastes umbrosus]